MATDNSGLASGERVSHCPLPWRVVPRKNARGQELTPSIVAKRSWSGSREWPVAVTSAISYEETNANAAYIVKACNAFPALLEACIAARKYLEERGIRHQGTVGRTQVLPLLDQAIDAAMLQSSGSGSPVRDDQINKDSDYLSSRLQRVSEEFLKPVKVDLGSADSQDSLTSAGK